jgi:two-component system response regulator AtoC
MKPAPMKILVADDDASIREMLEEHLSDEGYRVVLANDGRSALTKLEKEGPDVMLLDVRLPDMDGLQVLDRIKRDGYATQVVMISAHGSSVVTIQAMQRGAYDYITKPFDLDEVSLTLRRLGEHLRLARQVQTLEEAVTGRSIKERLVGDSPSMQQVYKTIGRVAASEATILLLGETGTGKELVAEMLHVNSNRSKGPLIKVNCAALPETLLESELFGHEKGAFTGAAERRQGRFELADGGTIFLDEIGEMSPSTQKKFLRVLQEGEFQRVGGTQTLKVDVRVVAATNKDLAAEMEARNFREDLYYRINVITIRLPSLRERTNDIPLLVAHFLEKYRYAPGYPPTRISDDALKLLLDYGWPGNVRQLENVIARAVVLSAGDVITPQHISLESQAGGPAPLFNAAEALRGGLTLKAVVAQVERDLVLEAMRQAEGDKVAAARALGLSSRQLSAKLAEVEQAELAAG